MWEETLFWGRVRCRRMWNKGRYIFWVFFYKNKHNSPLPHTANSCYPTTYTTPFPQPQITPFSPFLNTHQTYLYIYVSSGYIYIATIQKRSRLVSIEASDIHTTTKATTLIRSNIWSTRICSHFPPSLGTLPISPGWTRKWRDTRNSAGR